MSDKYRRVLQQLLPPGILWATSLQSNFVQFLGALAVEPQRVEDAVQVLLDESIPSTASDEGILSHWESLLGITEIAATTEGRRGAIRAKLLARATPEQQFSEQTLRDIASDFGQVATFTYHEPFRVGISRVGSPLYGQQWLSVVTIATPTHDAAMEAAIRAVTPSHIYINFVHP